MFLLAMLPPILWGSTYAAVGMFLTDLTPIWVSVYRAIPAGILLLVLFRRVPVGEMGQQLCLGILNIGLFFICLMVAAYRLPGGIAGTLSATLPLQLMFVQWFVLKRVPPRQMLFAALIGLSGVVILLNPSFDLDYVGVAAALLATSLVVIVTLLMERWPSSDIIGAATWQLIFGGLFLLPIAYIVEGNPQMPQSSEWVGLGWLSILNTGIAYVLFVFAIRRVGPTIFGFFTLLNPLTAVSLGSVMLGEELTLIQCIGIALVLGSLVLVKAKLSSAKVILERFKGLGVRK